MKINSISFTADRYVKAVKRGDRIKQDEYSKVEDKDYSIAISLALDYLSRLNTPPPSRVTQILKLIQQDYNTSFGKIKENKSFIA